MAKVVLRSLLSTGSEVSVVNSPAEFEAHVSKNPIDFVLIDYDSAEGETKALVNRLLDNPGKFGTVLLSQKKEKEHLVDLFSHNQLRNLIARNTSLAEEELIITTEKLARKDIFGVEKYLTWGVDIMAEDVFDSAGKDKQVARIGEFVRNLKCDERFVRVAEVVADEIIMNALYDAPVDSSGKFLYAHLPRTERVKLDPKDGATLQYGSDGRYFAIACRDRFGSLKAETVTKYLKKCFMQDSRQVDTKEGGAGVGFYMIFQSLSQLVINIEPGKATEIIGLIDIRTSYRDTKTKSKSFNIFLKN